MTNLVQEHLGWFHVSVGKYFFICAGKRKMDPSLSVCGFQSDVQPSRSDRFAVIGNAKEKEE